MKYNHVVFGLLFPFLKTDQCAAEVEPKQASLEFAALLLLARFYFSPPFCSLSDYLHELRLNRPVLQRFYDLRIMVSHPKPALVGRVASSG